MSVTDPTQRHVPKIRDCFECTKRRVRCDRAKPCCFKCQKKGLECSGFGVRHRFASGVASRGKWAGKTMQAIFDDDGDDERHEDTHTTTATTTTTTAACTPHQDAVIQDSWTPCLADAVPSSFDFPPHLQSDSARQAVVSFTESPTFLDWAPIDDDLPEPMPTLDPGTTASDPISDFTPLLLSQWPDQTNDPWSSEAPTESRYLKAAETLLSPPRFPSSPEGLDSADEFMLLYFSRHIAREMMILDGPHNGWRYLILPMARTDRLVRDAVLAVSCFHLCLSPTNPRSPSAEDAVSQWQLPGPGLHPRHLYTRAVKGLHSRQLMSCDRASQFPVLVTIMVLLTGSMVTGDQDFPILFRMLQSAFDALGGEQGLGGGDLAAFLVRQIHKLSVYAAPLISEENGLQTMQSPVRMMQVFECLNYCAQQQPKHQQAITTAISIIHQARDIYLNQTPPSQRFSEDPSVWARSVARVQAFIDTLESFPQDHTGEQVLLWASFVAASDCTIDAHKDYFESFFRRHHARNGFMNLLKAVDSLRRIWGRGLPEKWACLLPEEKLFVM